MGEPRLVEQNYSTVGRIQTVYFGEVAGVSEFDPNDLKDITNMGLIFSDPGVQEFLTDAKGATTQDNIDFAMKVDESTHVYAVRGSADGPVNPEEVGEAQGYIATWTEGADTDLQIMIDHHLLPDNFTGKKAFGIACATRPGVPRHQMASAIRTVCQMLRAHELENSHQHSSDVLTTQEDIPITAFIEVDNLKSQRLLRRCGFEKLPGELTHETTENRRSNAWILNWANLDAIMQLRADKKLLQGRHLSSEDIGTMI
jgi:hypothetical protein